MANLSGEEGKRHILGVVSSFAQRLGQNHLKDYEFDIDVCNAIGMWRGYQHPTPAQLIDILPGLSLGYTISEIIYLILLLPTTCHHSYKYINKALTKTFHNSPDNKKSLWRSPSP